MISSRAATGCCMVALVVLTAAGCDFFKGSRERAARAEALIAKGAYGEAMIELKNAQGDAPDDAHVRWLIAKASVQLGNLDVASKALDDAASAGADRVEVAALGARILMLQGKYVELLAFIDEPMPVKDASAATLLRVQALGGLDRCNEAIPLGRTLVAKDGVNNVAAAIVIGDCYARHGALTRALREVDAAVAGAPADADAWLARGRLQRLLGMNREAEDSLAKASQYAPGQLTVPQQAVLYTALADLQVLRNDAPALRKTWDELLRVAPQAAITALVGARLQLMENDVDGAIDALRRLANTAGELQAVHVLLASGYIAQAHFEQARQELEWIERQVPDANRRESVLPLVDAIAKSAADSEEFWLRSAAAQISLGQADLARVAIERAQKIAPSSVQARLALAQLDLRSGNAAAALKLTSELAEKFPQQPEVLAAHAKMLAAANRWAESAAILERLQARAPSPVLALTLYQLRKQGALANVYEPLEQWLEKHPNDVQVRATYADALRTEGLNRRAIAQYEALVALLPKNAPAANNLAWLYYLEKDERAVPTARQAWQLAPKAPTIIDTYGWLLTEAGQLREGIEQLEVADAAGGITQPDIRLHLVVALDRNGDHERAQSLLKALLAETPDFPNRAEATRLLASLSEPGKRDAASNAQ